MRKIVTVVILVLCANAFAGEVKRGPLDPLGKIHIPIGVADSLDTLKTFVEAEGNFSPGFGSYGIYFWVYDKDDKKLYAPTMDGMKCKRSIDGAMIPSCEWDADGLETLTRICAVKRKSPVGDVMCDGAEFSVFNESGTLRNFSVYVALRALGPAGFPIKEIDVDASSTALQVEGHPALIANSPPKAIGVSADDVVGTLAMEDKVPAEKTASSAAGRCSGIMRYDFKLEYGDAVSLGFICPVLPGRRAVGHRWDGKSPWAQKDEATVNPTEGGVLQPDPGVAYYQALKVKTLFDEAYTYGHDLTWRAGIILPRVDGIHWINCFHAIVGHAAMSMNEGAPDVTVINYNVYNRDGVYIANIMQKAARFDLAEKCIDYFLAHPFNGRVQPEADNPGQILWIMGEHWKFTRDKKWLERMYPSAKKIVAMIDYFRNAPGKHFVSSTSLDFGDALPAEKRQELKPGACDGTHFEYTEAFDLAGIRAAVALADAMGDTESSAGWKKMADSFFSAYDTKFGASLGKGYGSYSVLWPCRIYPFDDGKAHEQFKGIGGKESKSWRYFPLATAHQGLLAGNREAGYKTIENHLKHPQMQGWYAFDEGGDSGQGNWTKVLTTWNPSIAMPHGWAIAEMHLLLRDSLLFEDGERAVLLAGVSPLWFKPDPNDPEHDEEYVEIELSRFPTHFGTCAMKWKGMKTGATIAVAFERPPAGGVVLRLPSELKASVAGATKTTRGANDDFLLPKDAATVNVEFAK